MADIVAKLTSRKFVALVAATALLAVGTIDQNTWLIALTAYCGANVTESLGVAIAGALAKKNGK